MRIAIVVALLVALYAVAGFLIAPRLVRHALLEDIPKTLGVTPTVGEIHINPFLFHVQVNDFALAGKDGAKLLGFQRLFVDFELSSLWHRAYSFGQIELAAPFVNATVARDGTLNLLELKPKSAPAPPASQARSEPIPALRIGSFRVTQASLSYADYSRATEFATILAPINFELKEFTTGVQGGLFTFTGSSKLGERVEWHGHVSVQPIESDGELHIENLQAHTIWEYVEDRLNFAINSGRLDVEATYKVSLQNGLAAQGSITQAKLSDLAVRPKDSDTDWIRIPALTLSRATADLSQRLAQVDSLSVSGLTVLAWREPDGSINLLKLAATPPPAARELAPPASTAETPPAGEPAAGGSAAGVATVPSAQAAAAPSAPWQLTLREFDVQDASISAEDRSTRPAAKLVLAPLSLKVSDASLDLSKPVKLALDTRINETGSLAVSGEVSAQPAAASLTLKVSGIDLTAAQPYIAQYTAMTLRSGRLGADGQVHYGGTQQAPSLQFVGNLSVEKLHTVDNALQDDFINWDRLDIRGLDYSLAPSHLQIAEVVVRKPYARVIIESDSSINVKRVLTAPGAASAAPSPTAASQSPAPARAAAPATAAAAAPSAPAHSSGAHAPAKRGAQAAPVQSAQAQATMPMSIKKIIVQDGRANFTDLSVTPNFSSGIQKLEGSVLGLSSKSGSRATVDLKGEVDAYSPVTVKGDVNLLSAALYTDLAMDFRNIELSIFNPYSGKFAGYNIAKGKLTTELHYRVEDRKLDAQHHVRIEQLEFGDKTTSKDAVSLPVKLAVALLKDRNGVIDLDLPVNGSLDDPQFRLAPIIWKVFVNILEKAVTAPFALLGRLFGKGPDLQFVDFEPGASTLDATATDKIETIVKALTERPQLKIEVPIAVVPDLDRPALVSTALGKELTEIQAQKAQHGAVPPSFDALDPAAKLELLTRLYQRDFGAEPKYPDEVTSIKQKPDQISAKIDFLTQRIREHLTVGDEPLRALGQQRAQALQQALLSGTEIDPERVFLVANDKAQAKDGAVRLELSLR
ncbi:MAG TPA: DUF748 domain-containing protein [Steroidobacteraceae bacterium]|nr:DUF748 domain-containing protein [Steroidobacteraceae bacterium]